MSNIHNNGPDDKLLDDEIDKLSQAYQQASSEEPPELLDQAILNRAHREVEQKDHWLDFGWIHALTTAAVVVLALSIILTQRPLTELEENGLAPTDTDSLEFSRAAEAETSGKLRELQFNEAEQKQEQSKERRAQSRDDASQALPAARVAAPQEDALLEEDTMQVNAPAASVLSKSDMTGFADESPAIEAGGVDIDSVKKTTDKNLVGHSFQDSVEEQLQAIVLLKQTGDETWKAELMKFIENYPDYPLPEELKN